MGAESKIEWTDHTFNPWIGCEKISQGCRNCYASVGTQARVSASRGLPLWGPGSARQVTTPSNWRKPIAWDRAAAAEGVRRRVFCASLADVFEDRIDLLAPRARLAMLIANTPNLDWLLLTKRPENADRLWRTAWGLSLLPADRAQAARPWLPNIWLGTTCEDQANANARLPHLLQIPAAVRFVSYEPAIGPIDFTRIVTWEDTSRKPSIGVEFDALRGYCGATPDDDTPAVNGLDWVIVGGESGRSARPFDLAWARATIEQCREAGVACFVKQLGSAPGEFAPTGRTRTHEGRRQMDLTATRLPLRHPKGGDWDEWPAADLRVRQWPEARA